MKFYLISVFLWLSCAVRLLAAPAPGEVYLVVGSDTAVWNVGNGVDVTHYHNHFLPDLYIQPNRNGYKVMDPAFRNRFLDSYSQPLKLTWWMLVGSVYELADNTDVPIPSLMPLYLMRKYHGESMRSFGDEVSLHYHTFFWSDYDGDGKYYWNQSRTFHECRADFDFALAQSLLEEEVFPVSFRSGWHYMDNEWQAYLNLLLPFSLHSASPTVHTDNVEPYDNVYDWSKATLNFIPYHPSTTNYQVAGDGIGWDVRSVKIPSVTQTMMNQMFVQAAGGTNQVACFWAHLPETDFLTNIAKVDMLAHVAASNYPSVHFRYCTAVEAMQRWLKTTDQTPPQLDVAEDIQGETVTLTLTVNEPIWQPQPFVAVKDVSEQYAIVACTAQGANTWKAVLPVPRGSLAKAAIAVTDRAGNVTTRVIRYIPDDIFIDNLDPQYAELSGNWQSVSNAAWGINARTAVLGQSDTARVIWALPVAHSGMHQLWVQVPAVSNGAGGLVFTVYSGNSNIFATSFATALPGKQWVSLGSVFLEQSVSNSLEILVTGANQAGTVAVADVIKLSPLAPQPGFISNVQVDASDTTANITWTTAAPATSLVEYGLGSAYGNFTPTNLLPVRSHARTLSNLAPDTRYFFQIDSQANGTNHSVSYWFATTHFLATNSIFPLTTAWRYTTNNLDRTNWQARSYNDAAWASGTGLLWVDTVNGTNSIIQPKGTLMPSNQATGFPWPTYYFRKHFIFTNNLAGVGLIFSNYIDDGAVFYLNGKEIYRQNMIGSPTAISNVTLATTFNCGGDATCPVVFGIFGNLMTNMVSGDNVLAVEVHNYSAKSGDITFGSALSSSEPYVPLPKLHVVCSGNIASVYWNGPGFVLQQAADLNPQSWRDVSGPVSSPFMTTYSGPQAVFYRLRRGP
jgi:hypothetical protein